MAFLHLEPPRCLGVDIAKDTITVSDGTSKATRTIPNTRVGRSAAMLKESKARLRRMRADRRLRAAVA